MNAVCLMYGSINFLLNDAWLKEIVKISLQDQFKQIWLEHVQNNSKTLNYRLFKDKLEFENYFDILEDRDLFTFCHSHVKGKTGFVIYVIHKILETSSTIY